MADTHLHRALYRTNDSDMEVIDYGAVAGRPLTADANQVWIDNTTTPSWTFSIFDGTNWGETQNLQAYLDGDGTSQTTNVLQAVIASSLSNASGSKSAVIASGDSNATAAQSASLASQDSDATNRHSAVVASNISIASGEESATLAAESSNAIGVRSAAIASLLSDSTGTQSATIASREAIASGDQSATLASRLSEASIGRSASIAVIGGDASIGGAVLIASSGLGGALANVTQNSLAGGNAGGITWVLESNTGNIKHDGVISTPAPDIAEWRPNLTEGSIANGTIVTFQKDEDGNFDKIGPSKGTPNEVIAGIVRDESIGGLISNSPNRVYETDDFWVPVMVKASGSYEDDNPKYKTWKKLFNVEFEKLVTEGLPDEAAQAQALKKVGNSPAKKVTKTETQQIKKEIPGVKVDRDLERWSVVGLKGELPTKVGAGVKPGDWLKGGSDGIGATSTTPTSLFVKKIAKTFDGTFAVAIVEVK